MEANSKYPVECPGATKGNSVVLFIINFNFYFTCTGVSAARMSMHHLYPQCSQRSEEGAATAGTAATDVCAPQDGAGKLNLGLLKEQPGS